MTDQIRLWEREKNRLVSHPGYLYADFSSHADFALVRDYAKSLSVLVWEKEEKRVCFVREEGHEAVKDFIRRRLMP